MPMHVTNAWESTEITARLRYLECLIFYFSTDSSCVVETLMRIFENFDFTSMAGVAIQQIVDFFKTNKMIRDYKMVKKRRNAYDCYKEAEKLMSGCTRNTKGDGC